MVKVFSVRLLDELLNGEIELKMGFVFRLNMNVLVIYSCFSIFQATRPGSRPFLTAGSCIYMVMRWCHGTVAIYIEMISPFFRVLTNIIRALKVPVGMIRLEHSKLAERIIERAL